MSETIAPRAELFHGVFRLDQENGEPQLMRRTNGPAVIPDPQSGRLLRIATIDAGARAICPSCFTTGAGGFVSFVQDLRLVYACPSCQELVWLPGA
jgi:hypothetical protein